MPWLIQTDFPAARQLHLRNRPPPLLLHLLTMHAFLRQCLHLRLQVVAEKVKFMRPICLRRVHRDLRRRKRKNQPSMTRVHMLESKNITQKCPVRLGVPAVDNHMLHENHHGLLFPIAAFKRGDNKLSAKDPLQMESGPNFQSAPAAKSQYSRAF